MPCSVLLNQLKRDFSHLSHKLETEGWDREIGIQLMQVLQNLELESTTPILDSEVARTLIASLKHLVNVKRLSLEQEVRLQELCEAALLYTPTSTALEQVQLYAIGDFSFKIKELSPKLRKNHIDLHTISSLHGNFELDHAALLIVELGWMQQQSPEQLELISAYANRCNGWIVLTHPSSSLEEQLPLLRSGATHFLNIPLRTDRLIEIIEECTLDGRINPFRIMIIDDSQSALNYYSSLLKNAGMEVMAINNPLNVPDLLDEFHPDVLLVDVEMPVCRGPELLTLIRQRRQHAHISAIYLTGSTNETLLNLARSTAADGFFLKHDSPDLLVSQLLAQARRRRRLDRLEHNELRKRLQHSKRLENFRTAVDQHAIVSMANLAGDITFANERFCETSGYSLEELINKNHRLLKSNRHPPSFYDHMWQTIASGKIWHAEVCNVSKSGNEYWVRSTIVPFLDADGLPEEYISIRTDITALKQTEHALMGREALYRSLITAVADGILVYQPDGRIIECNPAACALFGLSRTTLLCTTAQEQNWSAAEPYDDELPEHPAFRVFATGRSIRNRLIRLCSHHEHEDWIRVSAEPIFEGDAINPKLVVLSCTDVTLQLQTEQQLKDHLVQIEATIRAIPDPLFELENDGSYHFSHRADPVLLEIFHNHVTGKTGQHPIPTHITKELSSLISEACTTGASYGRQMWLDVSVGRRCFEFSITRKSNKQTPEDKPPLIILARDITARKKDEETLQLFRSLVDAADQAIRVADAHGKIEYVNPAYTRLMGYNTEELVGKSFLENFAPNQDEILKRIHDNIAAHQNWRGQLTLQRKDGSEFSSLSDINAIYNEETGALMHTFNIFIDYSKEIARQHLLEQAVTEANAANRAKSEFLSRMSHELRTPMNAIIGFAQLLELEDELNEDNQDNVREILNAGQHLLGLINEVLDLAKVESGRLDMSIEVVNCSDLIRSCVSLSRPLAEKYDVSLEVETLPNVNVRADAVRLKQILLNLISNAIKYNRKNGKVLIQCEVLDQDYQDKIRVHIRDTGHGIPPERLPELFQPFNRLGAERSDVEGTGIGLVITRNLLELMEGRLGIDSQPERGSDFWFELPLGNIIDTDDSQDLETAIFAPFDDPSFPTKNVLYIEDNPANRKLLQQIFTKLPALKLFMANDAESGLELADIHHPDLIVLDIHLADTSGYDILHKLRKNPEYDAVPIVALTANAMPEDKQHGLEAGFSDYLTKPLEIPKLMHTLHHFLIPQNS